MESVARTSLRHLMLRGRGLTKSFGAVPVLSGVDIDVEPGEIHAIVGENGAGKSTLMKVIAGLIHPDAGQLELLGKTFSPRDPEQARHAGVSLVSQELSLCGHLDVTANLVLGREPTRFGFVSRRRSEEAAHTLMQRVSLDIPLDVRVDTLPVGTRQLLEIARAVGAASHLLILDEPTSSLGRAEAQRLFEELRRLRSSGLTILYISHFLEEIRTICDRFTVLRDGKNVATGSISDVTDVEIIEHMAGRKASTVNRRVNLPVNDSSQASELILELRGLTGTTKPTDVSLALHRGEILGIAGLVGSGRTELFRAIFGLDPVLRGEVCVHTNNLAINLTAQSPKDAWSKGLGMLSEDRKTEGLMLARSITDNIVMTRMETRGALVNDAANDQAAAAMLVRLAVKANAPTQRVDELSGGNQQKVALCRLLHHDADVLLLDEPTRGIDVGSKAKIWLEVERLADHGKAVLVISSQLPELLAHCDRIVVMHKGIVTTSRQTQDWTEHTLLAACAGAVVGSDQHAESL